MTDLRETGRVADQGFCDQMAADLGVGHGVARTAFMGEATTRVMGVVGWAMDKTDDPEERGRMVTAWAKKRRAGAFRTDDAAYFSLAGTGCVGEEGTYRENVALAKMLAAYWKENPRRLARILDEVEMWINLRDDTDDGERSG